MSSKPFEVIFLLSLTYLFQILQAPFLYILIHPNLETRKNFLTF